MSCMSPLYHISCQGTCESRRTTLPLLGIFGSLAGLQACLTSVSSIEAIDKMTTGILKVEGTQVVDRHGSPVILRGAAIGGWLKFVARLYQSTIITWLTLAQHGKLHHRLPGP